ncbi:MAG: non-heme Fe2+,alpha-ketoglutarate-dependent halogenase [Gammaproteobacteria bacterium]|jgi:non-heme Fe2+,alpha-ketoglutarate-dependent halogenase
MEILDFAELHANWPQWGWCTAHERNDYHDRGFVSPLAGYSIEEAQYLLRNFEALEAEFGGAGALQGTTRQYRPHRYLPWAADLVRHPPILDAVESLIGPDSSSIT